MITCCIVGATSIGIVVESPDVPNPKADTWVGADGSLHKCIIGRVYKIKSIHNIRETDYGVMN